MTVRYARAIVRRARMGAIAILWSFGLCFLLVATPSFVSADECDAEKAKAAAESRHGGTAIDVWVDGDYFIVRLEYDNGTVFDVGINRWNC